MRKFNPEKELSKIRNSNKKKVIISICALLVVGILGYSFALYQVRHTQKLVFNTVGEFKKRDIYLSVLVDGKYQNDFPAKSDDILYGGYECDGDAKINFVTDKWQVALYTNHPDKCTIKFGHKYVDQSGANYPELYQGMIPVYFENGKIYVADVTSEWYNYDDNKWANAVLIDYQNKKDKFYDDNGNLLGGHEVSEEDILQMYVWIPRYKYELFNAKAGETTPKQIIKIEFEEGLESTGDVECTYKNLNNGTIEETCVDKEGKEASNGEWYTHPAFTFKGTTEVSGTELKGIWAGKFSSSDPNDVDGHSSTSMEEITILPNRAGAVSRTVETYFNASRAIESEKNVYNLKSDEIDTHMMKNIEWGAISYLTQSVYGIYKDEKTCNIEEMAVQDCKVWLNSVQRTDLSTSISGCGSLDVDGTIISDPYDDNGIMACSPELRWDQKGVKASTTGNMYGIYDMHGGSNDYVMANIININSTGCFDNHCVFIPSESKYYDLYSFNESVYNTGIGHLGDATRELLNNNVIPYTYWLGNRSAYPVVIASESIYRFRFMRGGLPSSQAKGVYSFSGWGESANNASFHSILIAQN